MKNRSEIYRKRILEIFDRLGENGGKMSFYRGAVEAVFTADEWEAMLMSKPQWEITLTDAEGDV